MRKPDNTSNRPRLPTGTIGLQPQTIAAGASVVMSATYPGFNAALGDLVLACFIGPPFVGGIILSAAISAVTPASPVQIASATVQTIITNANTAAFTNAAVMPIRWIIFRQ